VLVKAEIGNKLLELAVLLLELPQTPMVAPSYAKARSELAKAMGLGQRRKKTKGKRATA
jgi:hypothetical protein